MCSNRLLTPQSPTFSTPLRHHLPQLLPRGHQYHTSGCDSTGGNPTPYSHIKYSNTSLPAPRGHANHRTPHAPQHHHYPSPYKPRPLATHTHNAQKFLLQSCSDSKHSDRPLTPIHSTHLPQYPNTLCLRAVHSTFPCPLMDHLPQRPPTSESFTPVPPVGHPSQCSPLMDSPPTSSGRKLSRLQRPTQWAIGSSPLM